VRHLRNSRRKFRTYKCVTERILRCGRQDSQRTIIDGPTLRRRRKISEKKVRKAGEEARQKGGRICRKIVMKVKGRKVADESWRSERWQRDADGAER
jgi:hypothetical protein